MKKIIVIVCILVIAQLACEFSPSPSSTEVTKPERPAAIDFSANILSGGTDIYAGPGLDYPMIGNISGEVIITGQGYGCTWFQVYSASTGLSGWLSADKIAYTVACADVPGVTIPATLAPSPTKTFTPTITLTLTPTFTLTSTSNTSGFGGSSDPGCLVQSSMTIGNRTGDYATFILVGPGRFYISLAPDVSNLIPVCEGCYDVYVTSNACGASSGAFVFTLCDGFDGWIYCP
jgi:hypothetical protein